MSKRLFVNAVLGFVALLLLLTPILVWLQIHQAPKVTLARFDQIHEGTSKTEVLKILGPPDVSELGSFARSGRQPINEREKMQLARRLANNTVELASWAHWQCTIKIIFASTTIENGQVTYAWGMNNVSKPLLDNDSLFVLECEYSDKWETAIPLKDRRRLVHRFPALEQ